MATLTLGFESVYLGTNASSYSWDVSYTPPANVNGKLCRLTVDEFLVSADDIPTYQIYALSADITEPFGTSIALASGADTTPGAYSTITTTSGRNITLATNLTNLPYNPSGRSILVQLPDGPMNIKFMLSASKGIRGANGTYPTNTDTTKGKWINNATYNTPNVFAKLTFLPVDKNNHFEKLESYSTGPFVRI